MLTALSIRDIVLVDRLDLEVGSGLTVLTGETGAGKSIILDALGLALGARSDAGLVRAGAAQAVATATHNDDVISWFGLRAGPGTRPFSMTRPCLTKYLERRVLHAM